MSNPILDAIVKVKDDDALTFIHAREAAFVMVAALLDVVESRKGEEAKEEIKAELIKMISER